MQVDEFRISSVLAGHDAAIRALCVLADGSIVTGGQDCLAKRWQSVQDTLYFQESCAVVADHWVVSLAALAPGVIAECPDGGFVCGSMDKLVRVFSLDGTLVKTLSGHGHGVISLDYTTTGSLISGSWDETAKVWDLDSGTCTQTLSGHENGVSVLGLSNGNIATASTGRQEGDTVVDFKIRIWQDGSAIKVMQPHTAAVRNLALLPDVGFASCSNDGTVRTFSFDGSALQIMVHSDGFVYNVCTLSTGELVSVSEDCSLKVWSDGTCIQTIQHPRGMWCVCPLPNGDFISGCQDSVSRIFSKTAARMAEAEVQSAFEEAVKEQAAKMQSGPSADEVAALPALEESHKHPGNSDGQVKMFRKNDKAFAYQWSGPSSTWVEIGEVTGSANRETLDGETYDFVWSIELESPTTGAVQTYKLGYNQTQEPYQVVVADSFINKHGLDPNFRNQIAEWIKKQSQSGAPTLGMDESAAAATAPTYRHFPGAHLLFSTIPKFEAVTKKMTEFSAALETDQMEASEQEALALVVKVLSETNRYHSSRFQVSAIRFLRKVVECWPIDKIFPALDLARLAVCHPDGAKYLASPVFRVAKAKGYATHENKNVRAALATVLLNTAVALGKNKPGFDQQKQECIIGLAQVFGDGVTEVDDTMYRACVGMGTMLVNGTCPKEQFGETEVPGKLLGLDLSARSAKLKECITEMKQAYFSMS